MSQQNDFPEVSEFLQKIKIRKSMFGYEKEDVMIKMQQLNRLYQDRMLMLKGQMDQEHQILNEERARMKAENEEVILRMQKEMEENRQALAEQLREEERVKLLADMEERCAEHQNELRMLSEELNRVSEQLKSLRGHVQHMAEELEKQ